MTDLNKETLHTSYDAIQRTEFGIGKFVRQDDRIVWDSTRLDHDVIAENHRLNNPQDAGFISVSDIKHELTVINYSSTLHLPENPDERSKTGEVLERIVEGSGIGIRIRS